MQTSYDLNAPQAVLGMTSEDFKPYTMTAFPGSSVKVARLLCADLTSGKPSNYAKKPASGADIARAMGVVMADFTREGGVNYPASRATPLVRRGRIWCLAEGTITRWSPLFARHTANGGLTDLGGFRADGDSDTAAMLEGAISLTDATDGQLFLAEFDLRAGRPQFLTLLLGTLSTKASDAAVLYMPVPKAGRIVGMKSSLNNVLATADATLQLQSGATAGALANTGSGTTGRITITSPGAAGDVDTCAPATTNVDVKEGDLLKVAVAGGSTATGTCSVQVTLQLF